MAEQITVRRNTRPTLVRTLLDIRNQAAPGTVVDITGYAIKFIAKPDLDVVDSRAFFDLSATLSDPTNGEYKLDLVEEHTALAPGTYPAEIRWWVNGVTTEPPDDSIKVDFVVESEVNLVV